MTDVQRDLIEKASAGIGAAATGSSALAVWLADMEIYLRCGVAVTGIIVGVFTILYYREAWLEKRRARAS